MTDRGFSEYSFERPYRGQVLRYATKRVFDIFASAALLILLAPVFAVIWIAIRIRLKSDAPAFYGHQRIGKDGARFRCLKFKTMLDDGDEILSRHLAGDPAAKEEWERTHKLRDDPRVLPGLGHFLRCSSLDELPQLFNVLRGDMSLVGPRPVIEEELVEYGASRRHYLSVRPGLTGPWQVGERSDCDFAERVRQDRNYVMHGSFATDIAILLKTLTVPFRRDGAY